MAIVYFEDKFVDESKAVIPVKTHALHYGTSIFEGIRSYGDGTETAIFRATEHYERFLRNAQLLRMEPAWSADQLVQLTIELLQQNNNFSDTYIRPLLFKSATSIGAHIYPGETLTIFAAPWEPRPSPPPPLTAAFSKWRRNSHMSVPAGAKIGGLYVNSALAIDEVRTRGYDQAVMMSVEGEIAEGYGANLFAVFGSVVLTPPESADILAGITRATVIRYLKSRNDLEFRVESIAPDKLPTADEIFLCGTGLEVIPLGHLEGKPIGNGGAGPITLDVAKWYRDVVTGKASDAPDEWRTIVRAPEPAP